MRMTSFENNPSRIRTYNIDSVVFASSADKGLVLDQQKPTGQSAMAPEKLLILR